MEVLEYKYDYRETKVITCNDCNSRLKIIETDIEEYDNRYYNHQGFVKCPVCHSRNYVDWNGTPD